MRRENNIRQIKFITKVGRIKTRAKYGLVLKLKEVICQMVKS